MPTFTVQGSDAVGAPQGAILGLILAEMRVQTLLLQALVSGQEFTDSVEMLRRDVLIEPNVVTTYP
jgi:hypothetical protein